MTKALIILLILEIIAYCCAATHPHIEVLNDGLTTEVAAHLRSCDVSSALKRWNDNQNINLNVTSEDSIVEIVKSSYSAQPEVFDCVLKFIFSLVDIQLQGLAAKQLYMEMVNSNGVAGTNIFPLAYQINRSIVAHKKRNVGSNESIALENHLSVLNSLPGPVKTITLADNFKFRNKLRGGYMYAADFFLVNDRRLVFRWNPGNPVTTSDWQVSTTSARDYYLWNTYNEEYLYASSDFYSYDDYRRSVLCWEPGNPVTGGHWSFDLNSDLETIKITTIVSVREYLYADSIDYLNIDRGYIFTNRGGGVPSGSDWYVQ